MVVPSRGPREALEMGAAALAMPRLMIQCGLFLEVLRTAGKRHLLGRPRPDERGCFLRFVDRQYCQPG